MSALVPLPVILPLLGAGLALMLSKRPGLQRAVSTTVLTVVVVVAAVLVHQADRHGPQVVWIGAWKAPLGISLVADRLSALMVLVSAVVTLAVLVYSLGQGMTGDGDEAPVSIYHPTFLVLSAGVSNAFLAGDLFNLFVSFEILLFSSYVLLTLGGTGARIRAGTVYVVVNVLSSSLFLIALAAVYAATGSLNLAQLAGRLDALPPGVRLVLQLLLLTTFSIKAAVFPLSFWLPDSYPTAPAPVTAVFAGLLTKVGVYAIIRTQTLLFPASPLTDLLLWAALLTLLTLLIGILGAVAQSEMKRMLSFTLVSHIGYMVFGIALGTTVGYSGAIFYVVHHITIQTALFLVLGLVEWRAGSTSLVKLGGLARVAPLLGLLFFVPAMNLAGIPPMSGFLGKVALTDAGLRFGTPLAYAVVVAGMLTSLLTLYAVAKAWNLAFWRTPEQAHEMARQLSETDEWRRSRELVRHRGHVHVGPDTFGARDLDEARSILDEDDTSNQDFHQLVEAGAVPSRLPRTMTGATGALVVLSLGLTVVAGPVFGYTGRAAHDLLDRQTYIGAVLERGGLR
jgi:multicomponent Na+:H+ antiporter subunit D